VPTLKPFDLFHPDRKRRVKLYVKRVFITDEGIDLIPHYLRFLRGVVDSQDLPLNISRETLQANPVLMKIRDAVAKKVLGELKKKAEADAEGYAAFWENFGAVLKEGLCEPVAPKEQILEVCRFHSQRSEAGDQRSGSADTSDLRPPTPMTSLDDYVTRMKADQDTIYYLTGERLEALRGSPQLEGFARRGIEVLLLNDHVDDFWLTVVHDYKGKIFKSVTRADIDLGDTDTPDAPPPAQTDQLVARLKETYGDAVRDVRITHKLTDSAVCLAVEEGAMDMRLERFLVEQKQLPSTSSKILEINPQHPIIRALAQDTPDFADIAWLLLDQARIVEGEEIRDPAAFARRLNRFVQKGLAA
jgi:molecular chaperone HtpG